MATVLLSGLLISILVTQRYSSNLRQAVIIQARYFAKAVALEAADLVLTDDLAGLQLLLERQLKSNPALRYLFVSRNNHVLVHTFANGLPAELIDANRPLSGEKARLREILTDRGELILDFAFPIFHGKAGILRIGYSEEPYRRQVRSLQLQMMLFTLVVLVIAVGAGFLFVRRLTGPLTELSRAVDRVDEGELDVRVKVRGDDELAALATSFNSMLSRIRKHTSQLETQARELDRAHVQTQTICSMVREIGATRSLQDIGTILIDRLRPILAPEWIRLLIMNEVQDHLYVVLENRVQTFADAQTIDTVVGAIGTLSAGGDPHQVLRALAAHQFIPAPWTEDQDRVQATSIAHEGHPYGIMLIGCGDACRCGPREMELVATMIVQAAGVIKRAIIHEQEVRELQDQLDCSSAFCGIIGKDPKMQSLFKLISDVAPSDATVLIQGESGTGKELVARAIHQQSPRKNGPFVVINCAAYPATLLESELFGHEKGAFTGANRRKPGRFEQGDGGTVFLDEIGEISPSAQLRLLRVLQTQQFERLGGTETLKVDVRVLAATHRDLAQAVKRGSFREDLYYRLNVIPLRLPALRERRNDIPLLAHHFLHRFSREHQKAVRAINPEAMRRLMEHGWPGNVRELENTMEHAVVLAKTDTIMVSDFPASLRTASPGNIRQEEKSTLQDRERQALLEALEQSGWNKKNAAKLLGISRSTLYAKLKKHRISPTRSG